MKTSFSRTRIVTTALMAAFVLSAGVASAHRGGPRGGEHMFEKADANKDGKITVAEAKKVADERFSLFDMNKDGAVTKEEAKAAWEKKRAEMQQKRAARGADPSKGKHSEDEKKARHHRPGKHGDRFFAHLDTNNDGKITRAEAEKFETDRFNAVDANKDGAITRDEIKAHHEAMRAKWKEKRDERREGKNE